MSCTHQKIGLLIKFWLIYGFFLSISAFVSIIFCNFAVKQQKSIMAKLNRIRVEALIAIANALEVPVQELVRQEEFNQEKYVN